MKPQGGTGLRRRWKKIGRRGGAGETSGSRLLFSSSPIRRLLSSSPIHRLIFSSQSVSPHHHEATGGDGTAPPLEENRKTRWRGGDQRQRRLIDVLDKEASHLARGRHRTDSNMQSNPTQKVTVKEEEPDATISLLSGKSNWISKKKDHGFSYKSVMYYNSGDLSVSPGGAPSAIPGCSSCQCGTRASATTAAKELQQSHDHS